MENEQPMQKPTSNNRISLSLDMRVIIFVLLAVIAGMLFVWKPWSGAANANDRTVSVTGEAKVTEAPDEYVFYPSYEFKDANKEAALAASTKKSKEVTAQLKALGVEDSKIKVDADGYNYGTDIEENPVGNSRQGNTYSLRLTIKVDNKQVAQKVQDYLITTQPMGQVTPQASFSDAKRKELESKARDQATKDARAKADQSARNIGFKVGKVKSIQDGAGFGNSISTNLMQGADLKFSEDSARTQSLTLQPGQNDLHYSVTIVYYVK